jgi:HEAT repeat protein
MFHQIGNLFRIPWVANTSTIVLSIIWLLLTIFGYFIMASQVKLVKKEIWTIRDTLKCATFGIMFGSGIIIIITMMETFTLANMEIAYQDQAPFILIPLILCLGFISLYPLIEFLFMAAKPREISVTPIQKPFESTIKKVDRPYSYFVAIGLYFALFIAPILILIYIFNVEFIIAWISCALIYPVINTTYYGSVGFVVGMTTLYARIPAMERSTLLAYDSSERATKEFAQDPITRIVFFILVFVYFYEFYAVYRTLSHYSLDYIPVPTPSWFNIDWSIPIILIFAITAYFVRYWNRKVKLSAQSIFFSGFLIAAVGVNVLVNYMVGQPAIFQEIFQEWAPTAVLYDVRGLGTAGNIVLKHSELHIIGVLEELTLVVVITFFLFLQKNRKFINQTLQSAIITDANNFLPIPAFNMIRYKDPEQRQFAKDTLFKLYTRIPLKDYDYLDPKFNDPLFDAITDGANLYAQQTGMELLGKIIMDSPKNTRFLIDQSLSSPNFDKVQRTTQVLIDHGKNILPLLDISLFFSLLQSPENHIRRNAARLIKQKFSLKAPVNESKPSQEEIQLLLTALEDPDYIFQAQVLDVLVQFMEDVPTEIFSSRLNHPSLQVRKIVAKVLSEIKVDDIAATPLEKLIKMLDHTNPEIQSTAMLALAKLGGFVKNKIPILPFKEGLIHEDDAIRFAATTGLRKYIIEKPNGIKAEEIISLLLSSSPAIQKNLLQILGDLWQQSPTKVFPVLIQYLRSSEATLQSQASLTLVEMGLKNPKQVVKKLIQEQDTVSFIRRGKIADTIVKISGKHWKHVIQIALKNLDNKQEHIRINAASVLAAISATHPDDISIDKVFSFWFKETSPKTQKEFTSILANVAKTHPEKIGSFMPKILKLFNRSDLSVKKSIGYALIDISKKNPELIDLKFVSSLSNDGESAIRELGMKLVGNVGQQFPKKSMKLLVKGIEDQDWPVKNAAAEALSILGTQSDDKEILSQIKKMLKDSNKWSRKTAVEVFAKAAEKNPSVIPIKDVIALIKVPEQDETIRVQEARLLGNIASQNPDKAFRALIPILADPSEKIRNGGVSGMIRLSRALHARDLVPKLLHYLSDETDIHLQESVALVLKRVVKYESKSLRERVVSLLTIRVGISQNEILSSVLNDIQD